MDIEEALEKLSFIPIYEEDKYNVISDIDSCCIYKGDLCEVYETEFDTIKKDLEVLEILKNSLELEEEDDYISFKFKFCFDKESLNDDYEMRTIKEWLENEN